MSAAVSIGPILTVFLNIPPYQAVGTSVFIMAFTALTGSISHFAIGALPVLVYDEQHFLKGF